MPVRRCRCRNFALTFDVLNERSEFMDIISDEYSDLLINGELDKVIEFYPNDLKDFAYRIPIPLKVDPTTLVLKHRYEGMQATAFKLFEGLPSAEVIFCANCKTPIYIKLGQDMYTIPNILCDDEEIPKTWPMKTDSDNCIKYSKKFDILYYDDEVRGEDYNIGTIDQSKQNSIELAGDNLNGFNGSESGTWGCSGSVNGNYNFNVPGTLEGSLNGGSLATMMGNFSNESSSAVSAAVMKSMKHIKDNYANSLRRDIQKRCDVLSGKLDKNMEEIMVGTDDAIESVIMNAKLNSERKDNIEICPLYTEISSSSSSVQLQTPVLSGCNMSDDGMLSLTPEGFNTVEKPHGLPGRTADTDAKIKIAKLGSYIRNSFEVRQKGLE